MASTGPVQEFFAAIGFKIDGNADLVKLEASMLNIATTTDRIVASLGKMVAGLAKVGGIPAIVTAASTTTPNPTTTGTAPVGSVPVAPTSPVPVKVAKPKAPNPPTLTQNARIALLQAKALAVAQESAAKQAILTQNKATQAAKTKNVTDQAAAKVANLNAIKATQEAKAKAVADQAAAKVAVQTSIQTKKDTEAEVALLKKKILQDNKAAKDAKDAKKDSVQSNAAMIYILNKLSDILGSVSSKLTSFGDSARNVGNDLKNNQNAYGIDPQVLQTWDRLAELTNTSKESVRSFVVSSKNYLADLRLGKANPDQMRAWSILGITPTDDPVEMFEQVRRSVKSLAPEALNTGRRLLEGAGVDTGLFRSMVEANARGIDLEALAFRNLSKDAVKSAQSFNVAKTSLENAWDGLKNKLGVSLDRVLEPFIRGLTFIVDTLSKIWDGIGSGGQLIVGLGMSLVAVAASLASMAASAAVVFKLLMAIKGLSFMGVTLAPLVASVSNLTVAAWALAAPFLAIGAIVAGTVATMGFLYNMMTSIVKEGPMLKGVNDDIDKFPMLRSLLGPRNRGEVSPSMIAPSNNNAGSSKGEQTFNQDISITVEGSNLDPDQMRTALTGAFKDANSQLGNIGRR